MFATEPKDQRRRREPRIVDTDWLVLRDLSRAVDANADALSAPGLTAIDFGCGDQPYRRHFETRGVVYRGADLDQGAEVRILSDGTVQADNASANLVLSFQVLEHVRDLDTYLTEAKRILHPDGRLLLSTHGTWLYHPHPQDHRRWTREGLVNELQSRGWTVEKCEAICGPLAWTTMIRLTGYCYAVRRIPVVGKAIGALLAVAMNLRAALEDQLTPKTIRDDNACVYLVQARPAVT